MKREAFDKIIALITAAFGFVAALAWNGFVQALFKDIFGEQSTTFGMLTYAVIVTIIAVVVIIWLGKASEKINKRK